MTFRRLVDTDLPKLHAWLNDPAVIEWWEGNDVSWEAVVRDYGSGNADAVEHWLALSNGEPVGWIQCYSARDAVEGETFYWREHIDLERTGGIDYLIGEPALRGGGLGSRMIRTFVDDVAFALHPNWAFVAAGPFEANRASCRALAKAGFHEQARLDDEDGACLLMVIARA